MTAEEIKILKDMKAYIEFAIEEDMEFDHTLYELAHDCGGLLREEECFLPRSSGYVEHMKKRAPKLALIVHSHRHGKDFFPCRTLTEFPEITNELLDSLGGDGELERDDESVEWCNLGNPEEWPMVSDE